MLGDNIFFGGDHFPRAVREFKGGATIFAYVVRDPRRYGVIEFDAATGKALSIEEKPENPKSNFAVPGIYIYDNSVLDIAKNLKPSHRGELEITDLNRRYLEAGTMRVEHFGRGYAWLDTGSPDAMMMASQFVQVVENRQGMMIACPEEIAWRQGWLSTEALTELGNALSKTAYGQYLLQLSQESA